MNMMNVFRVTPIIQSVKKTTPIIKHMKEYTHKKINSKPPKPPTYNVKNSFKKLYNNQHKRTGHH